MAGPTVTLEFAGDSTKLTKTFDEVGSKAKTMGDDVAKGSSSFDKVGEGFDRAEQRAMGFRDMITGVQDSMSGTAMLAKGDFAGGLLTLGMGVGDLASGFSNLLVPALKGAVGWLKTTRLGMLAQAAASKVVAAGQWLLNAAMAANPIMIIVLLIALLVGAFIFAYNNSEDFRNIVNGAFETVKKGAQQLWEGIKAAFGHIVRFIDGAVQNIGGFLSGMWDGIGDGLRSAMNGVIGLINGAIGGINSLIWGINQIPGVYIPSLPSLPYLHQGGVVPGAPGEETMAMLQAGERVTPAGVVNNQDDRRVVRVDLGPEIMKLIRKQVRAEGGNVQIVLGAA